MFILEHIKYVRLEIERISPRGAFAFALSCTERQWPVFQQAAAGQLEPIENQEVFRKAIDVGWDHLFQDVPISNELLAACRLVLSNDPRNAPLVVMNTISNSIIDLLSAIQHNNFTYSHYLSVRNLGLIELLLDEQGLLLDDLKEDAAKDSPEVKRIRPLVEDEINHQDRDLQRLKSDDSDFMIETVKRESLELSLFNGVWFM